MAFDARESIVTAYGGEFSLLVAKILRTLASEQTNAKSLGVATSIVGSSNYLSVFLAALSI